MIKCAPAKIAGKNLKCDEVECSGWDHDKNQCMVNSFLQTYALLQRLAMEIKGKVDAWDEEDDAA